MRAFLSHSSLDKKFVGEVADFLGRSRVIFDAFEFSVGDDFHAAISRGLDRSDLFVLFASKASLASDWVKIEIKRAEADFVAKAIGKIACFIIDDDVDVADVPSWMTTGLVTSPATPRAAALEIRRIINDLRAAKRPKLFLGRAKAMEDASDIIADDVKPIVVNGLPGIGRRTFLSELGRNQLSYSKTINIDVRSGDELPELYVYLQDALGILGPGHAKSALDDAARLSTPDLVQSILSLVGSACAAGSLVIIVDSGALTSDDGRLLPGYDQLFAAAEGRVGTDFGVVASRRIRVADGTPIRSLRLHELDDSSTQRLIRLLGNHDGVVFSRDHLAALVPYVAGYPPAAIFAVQEAKVYGPDHVVQNQRTIVKFNERVFLAQLSADRVISPLAERILSLLSAYSPLPLGVISECLGPVSSEEMDDALTLLIDLSVVVPDSLNYKISAPIRDAAYRHFGGMRVDHVRVASSLERYLSENRDDDDDFTLSQSLFRAVAITGGPSSSYAVGLARDLIAITSQSYYDQNYDRVIEFGDQAIAARPNNVDVRRVVAQAFIRRERFDEANDHISKMVDLGALKEAFYVKGFLHRRKREYTDAIESYKRSIEYGRGGVAVHRELAQCYFYSGDLDRAYSEIRIAERSDPHNRYILDLKCTIAMKKGDLEEVDRCLRLLERVDTGTFAAHRRSIFELNKGNPEEAVKYARIAADGVAWPSYEVLANLANCEIEDGDFSAAGETLRNLDAKFANTNRDARLGLHCKLELRRDEPAVAEAFWNRIHNKELPVHVALRLGILMKKSALGSLSADESAEVVELERTLATADLGILSLADLAMDD